MKTGKLIFLFILFLPSLSFGQYVTIEGRQFKDENGNDFYPLVCNYMLSVITPGDPNDYSTSFVSPVTYYGPDGLCDCFTETQCNQQLLDDFNKILALGFNAVQFMGLTPFYHSLNDTWDCWDQINQVTFNPAGFYIQTLGFIPETDCSNCPFHQINSVNPPDAICQKIFEQTKNLIKVASLADFNGKKLKVILRPADVSGPYPQDIDPDFKYVINDFYYSFTNYLMNNLSPSEMQTLIAYDITSEMACGWRYWSRWPSQWHSHPTKQEVCDIYRLWYNTINLINSIKVQHFSLMPDFTNFTVHFN